MQLPKVTFGFVNCNRLIYLKSCVESTLLGVADYKQTQFIVVDNASIEEGTHEYLDELEKRGFTIFREEKRDPPNEYARALNTIVEHADGTYIVPLAGDTQCVAKKWVKGFVDFYEWNDNIGCICLNAQRTPTVSSHHYLSLPNERFLIDTDRPPIAGAADVFMKTQTVREIVYPWCVDNSNHEYPDDSETKMHIKVHDTLVRLGKPMYQAVPIVPVYTAIYTDPRGCNARVRLNRRYGRYAPPPFDKNLYYEMYNWVTMNAQSNVEKLKFKTYTMEDIAEPIGWKKMLDRNGAWKKNSINTKDPNDTNFVELE